MASSQAAGWGESAVSGRARESRDAATMSSSVRSASAGSEYFQVMTSPCSVILTTTVSPTFRLDGLDADSGPTSFVEASTKIVTSVFEASRRTKELPLSIRVIVPSSVWVLASDFCWTC